MSLDSSQEEVASILTKFNYEIIKRVNDPYSVRRILEIIYEWTGGQPLLTDILCESILNIQFPIIIGKESELVEEVVYKNIINDWEKNRASVHLKRIQESILSSENIENVLNLYVKLLHGENFKINTINHLKDNEIFSTGLVRINNGNLEISNSIYEKIFNLEWMDLNFSDLNTEKNYVEKNVNMEDAMIKKSTVLLSRIILIFIIIGSIIYSIFYAFENNQNVVEPKINLSDMRFFDNGMEYGKNKQWLPMLREFCAISEKSEYFLIAKKQIELWQELYNNEMMLAAEIYEKERGSPCRYLRKTTSFYVN